MKKDDCIFCKIANGDFGTEFVLETDDIGTFVQFVKENDVKSVFYAFDEIEKVFRECFHLL